jgi:hypothetical protein
VLVNNADVTGRAAAMDDHGVAEGKGRMGAAHLVGDEEDLIVRAERSRLRRWRPASRGESVEGEGRSITGVVGRYGNVG